MSEPRCPHCYGPSKIDRENIYIQLRYLGHQAGQACYDETFDEDDALAMQIFLYELAAKVFPEGEAERKDAA